MRGLLLIAIAGAMVLGLTSAADVADYEEYSYEHRWSAWDWNDIEAWVSSTEVEVDGLKIRLGFREGWDFPEVNLLLIVTNLGEDERTLGWLSGKLFDFAVLQEGEEIWRFSGDRYYAETQKELTLAGGETLAFTGAWGGILDSGEPLSAWPPIDVEGELLLADGPIRLRIGHLIPDAVSYVFSAYCDVPIDYWAYAALDDMLKAGILEGYPEDWFSGNRTLTRYEFGLAIARLIDTTYGRDIDPDVQDVNESLKAEFADQLFEIGRQISKVY